MNRFYYVVKVSTLTLLVAVVAVLMGGCGKSAKVSAKVSLGPKPTAAPSQSQMVDDMRTWIETISPQDARTLQETGQIVFSYEKLKASDPFHAGIVDKYTNDQTANMTPRTVDSRGRPLSPAMIATLARPRSPEGVRFYRCTDGSYGCEIRFTNGGFSNMQLSDPQKPKD